MHPTAADMGQSIDQYFKNNFVEVTDPLDRLSGKQIFVAKKRYRDFDEITKSRNKNFNSLYICKQLTGLKGAGIFNSMFSRYTMLSRMLPIEGGQIIYCAWHSRIYITYIEIQLDLINRVNAESNRYLKTPDDIFENMVQQKDNEQKKQAKETKKRILDSHLCFKSVEFDPPG